MQQRLSHQQQVPTPILSWPPSGEPPINKLNTEGYISCAFSTSFTTGAADFVAPQTNEVTVGNYYKRLLMYVDGRFFRHPRFRYVWLVMKEKYCPTVCSTMLHLYREQGNTGIGSAVASLAL